MKKLGVKTTTYMILTAVVLAMLVAVNPASASRQGRRNTAAALGAATAYSIIKGHTPEALLFGAGTLYALGNINDRDDRWWRDRDDNWYRHHRYGYRDRDWYTWYGRRSYDPDEYSYWYRFGDSRWNRHEDRDNYIFGRRSDRDDRSVGYRDRDDRNRSRDRDRHHDRH
jgi:hypothetical protein